jgi:hypothetical protein
MIFLSHGFVTVTRHEASSIRIRSSNGLPSPLSPGDRDSQSQVCLPEIQNHRNVSYANTSAQRRTSKKPQDVVLTSAGDPIYSGSSLLKTIREPVLEHELFRGILRRNVAIEGEVEGKT